MVGLRHSEWKLRIDLVLLTWAERLGRGVLQDIHVALATSITVPVNAVGIRRITAMPCGSESPLVGLHDVKLGAPVAPNLIGVAVFERVMLIIDGGHEHIVKRSDAATPSLAQIYIILDAASKQISPEVTSRVDSIDRREVHSIVIVVG